MNQERILQWKLAWKAGVRFGGSPPKFPFDFAQGKPFDRFRVSFGFPLKSAWFFMATLSKEINHTPLNYFTLAPSIHKSAQGCKHTVCGKIIPMIKLDHNTFLDAFFQKLNKVKIDVSRYEMDHLGYQASSDEDYDQLKQELQKEGDFLDENLVGGRRVGLFMLKQPLLYKKYSINALELIAPKEEQVCPSALDHAEFIIDEDFESFTQKYPNLAWDKSKMDQPMFPMVSLKLDDNMQVKFHYKSVFEIAKEKLSKIII